MAKKTVIRLNHTLEEYNKKYGDMHGKIVNKLDADKDNSLIEGRTWWLIDEKYYEIPQSKCAPARWWTSMGTTGRVITCILGAGVIATAVAVPVALTMNQGQAANITVIGADVDKDTSKVELNKESTVVFNCANNKDFVKVNYVKVGDKEIANNLYEVKDVTTQNKKVVIKAEAMTSTKVEISVQVKDRTFVTSVTITTTETEVAVDSKIELTAKVLPENASIKVVDWEVTGGTAQASIETDGGKTYLKGLTVGKVTVRAVAADGSGKSDSKEFTVKEKGKKYTISLNETSKEFEVGDSFSLKATITENGEEPTLFWGTSGAKANAVDLTKVSNTEYTVTAKEPGSCNITVGCAGGNTAICEVTVKPKAVVYVTEISCDNKKTMTVGDEISFDDLNVKIIPADATDKTYKVEEGGVLNGQYIEVDQKERTIKAVGAGEQTVFITANGGNPEEMPVQTECTITVNNPVVEVTEKQWKAAIELASKQSNDSNFKLFKYETNATSNGSSHDSIVYVDGYNIEIDEIQDPETLTFEYEYEKETPAGLIEDIIQIDNQFYINSLEEKGDSSLFFEKNLDTIYDELNNFKLFTFNKDEGYYERTIIESSNKDKNSTLRLKFNSDFKLETFQEIDNLEEPKTMEVYEFSEYGITKVITPEEDALVNSLPLTKDFEIPGKYTSEPYAFIAYGRATINTIFCTLDAEEAGVDYTKPLTFTLGNDGESAFEIYKYSNCYVNGKEILLEDPINHIMTLPANKLSENEHLISFELQPETSSADIKLHAVINFTPKA